MKRRDFVAGSVAAAVLGALAKEVLNMIRVDGVLLEDDEKDIAREAMAAFIGSHPDPPVEDVAERGRLAVRAWRTLLKE